MRIGNFIKAVATESNVRLLIAYAITIVWFASYVLALFNHGYHPPAELNGLMVLIAGAFYAWNVRREVREDVQEVREERDHDGGTHANT